MAFIKRGIQCRFYTISTVPFSLLSEKFHEANFIFKLLIDPPLAFRILCVEFNSMENLFNIFERSSTKTFEDKEKTSQIILKC